jgi:hypothetical protein
MPNSTRQPRTVREFKIRRLISLGFFVAFVVAFGTIQLGEGAGIAAVLALLSLVLTVVVGMRLWR